MVEPSAMRDRNAMAMEWAGPMPTAPSRPFPTWTVSITKCRPNIGGTTIHRIAPVIAVTAVKASS